MVGHTTECMKDQEWTLPPSAVELEEKAVHVWRIPLTASPLAHGNQARLLSADETDRANRFAFSEDRTQYVAARGALRVLLGRYVGRPAHALRFSYGTYGKPALQVGPREGGVGFNVAHSGDWALCAVALTSEVGVDVEQLRTTVDITEVMRFGFADSEQAALEALPPTDRSDAFFRCWTQKEAYIKAVGRGLSLPLDSFEVRTQHPFGIRSVGGSVEQAREWTMWTADPASNYYGAVAVRGARWSVRFFDGSVVMGELGF